MSDDSPLHLDPDEPRTPGWFTFLGLGLFLLAGILFLVTSGEGEDGEATESERGAADTASADEAPAPD